MQRIQISNRKKTFNQQPGLGLVEVLVSFSILVIILMTVLQSRIGSVRRIEQTVDLNQIQDQVRSDLSSIRKQALKWQCVAGTACSGLSKDRYNPPRYSDSLCESNSPLTNFPIRTATLISDNDIELIRNVEANGKRLDISYSGQTRDKSFSTSASIIPQAMNWCG